MGGGGSTKQVEYQKSDPWAGQQPYLNKAFQEGSNIYDSMKGQMPMYTGDFVAQPSQDAQDFANNGLQTAMTQGQGMIDNTYGSSAAGTGVGLAGATGALGGLYNYAGTDPTQANIQAAGQYAANPYLDGAINSATRDVMQQFGEQALPTIDRNAAGTGNMNSTRAGVAQGIATRAAMQQAGDIASQMRYGAYNTGLQAAQQDQANRLSALQSAGQLGSGLYSTGLGGMGQAMDMSQTNANVGNLYSALQSQNTQAGLDNAMQRAEFNFNAPWANLQNLWGVVGDKSWGSEGFSIGKTSQNPSALSQIGTGAAIIGSLFKCDPAVKMNVRKTSETLKGFPVYTFEYVDLPGITFKGPMATDIEPHFPEAIVVIDGIKHIDMSKVA